MWALQMQFAFTNKQKHKQWPSVGMFLRLHTIQQFYNNTLSYFEFLTTSAATLHPSNY